MANRAIDGRRPPSAFWQVGMALVDAAPGAMLLLAACVSRGEFVDERSSEERADKHGNEVERVHARIVQWY